MEDLKDKVAIITGAGGAVGSALTRIFLEKGVKTVLLYRSDAHKEKLSRLINEFDTSVLTVQGDLNDMSFTERAVSEAENHFNRVDYMINPIGGWIGGKRLHDHSWDELEKMLSIDLKPTFNLLRAVLPVMVEQKSGKIINFSSMAAFGAGAHTAVYAASKAAVTQLTDSVAHEYGTENIQAFAIAPSTIDTEANRSAMPDADRSTWVSLEEIADAVLYLCTSGDSLSGTVLKFTGKII